MCEVVIGGLLHSHKGVSVPDSTPDAVVDHRAGPRACPVCAGSRNVDYLAMSFVRTADDMRELRWLMRHLNGDAAAHRQDREGRGHHQFRRHPRTVRRDHGGARRSGRRDARRARAGSPEEHHPPLQRGGQARDHGHADAQQHDRESTPDPRRDNRRRQRDFRRDGRGDALRRDGGRQIPAAGGRDDGAASRTLPSSTCTNMPNCTPAN